MSQHPKDGHPLGEPQYVQAHTFRVEEETADVVTLDVLALNLSEPRKLSPVLREWGRILQRSWKKSLSELSALQIELLFADISSSALNTKDRGCFLQLRAVVHAFMAEEIRHSPEHASGTYVISGEQYQKYFSFVLASLKGMLLDCIPR